MLKPSATLRAMAGVRAICPGGAGWTPGPGGRSVAASVALMLLFGFGVSDASAAALGSLVSSAGLLATLVTVFTMKGCPPTVSMPGVSTAGGALLVAAALAWLLPFRPRGSRGIVKMRVPNPGDLAAIRPDPAKALPANLDLGPLRAEFIALFFRVQRAWDRGHFGDLGDCTTPELMAELVAERAGDLAGQHGRRTEFVTVDAEVVAYETVAGAEVASVAFAGALRDDGEPGSKPFRELWLLMRRAGTGGASGWRLARHQVLY